MRVVAVLVAALPLLAGCSAGLFPARGPTLEELESGRVHLRRGPGTRNADVYLVAYQVQAPLDVTWDASAGVVDWLQETDLVSEIVPVRGGGPDVERFMIRTRRSKLAYPIEVARDDAKRMIEIRATAEDPDGGRVSYCNIRMRSFLEGTTLVESEVQVTSDLLSITAAILAVPAALLTGGSMDHWLQGLGDELAGAHRAAALAPAAAAARDPSRTHVIAVGVDDLGDAASARELKVRPLRWAQRDALAFSDWAAAAFPGDDDTVIRATLVGPRATSTGVQRVLNELKQGCLDDRVRAGDTVLFFFAGQLALGRNDLAGRGRHPHLLTYDADAGRLASTAILRDDVLAALRLSGASRCLLLCDASFGGGYRVTSVDELYPDRRAAPEPPRPEQVGASTVILAAEHYNLRAAESDELEHGVFTQALLEGLGGRAGDGRDGVSVGELETYVRDRVDALTASRQEVFVFVPPGFPADEAICRPSTPGP